MTDYFSKTNEERKELLENWYYNDKLSYGEIAKIIGTYSNRIRREAVKFGIIPRDRSEAQSVALSSGRHAHPTEGKERSAETKLKISEKRAKAWADLTPEEREKVSQAGKEQWKSMTPEEQKNFLKAAGDAIRKSSKEGSKLEKFIHEELLKAGYRVDFHKEQTLKNTKLQIDLLLPKENVAIEIDGPSHFEPIWGEKTYNRNQKADNEKAGLLLGTGMVLIRIQQRKNLSQKLKRTILSTLLAKLEEIKTQFPERGNRYIILGEKDGL